MADAACRVQCSLTGPPSALAAFTIVVNGDVHSELLGIGAGHVYYFLQGALGAGSSPISSTPHPFLRSPPEVLPNVESPLRGFHLLRTPDFLYTALGLPSTHAAAAFVHMGIGRGGGAAPPPPGGRHQWGGGGVVLGR